MSNILCCKSDNKFFVKNKAIKIDSFFNNFAKKLANYTTKECKNLNPAKYISNDFIRKITLWYKTLMEKEKVLIEKCSYKNLIKIKAIHGGHSSANFTSINKFANVYWCHFNSKQYDIIINKLRNYNL